MKTKFMKRTVSLVLSIIMICSMTTVGLVSVSASEKSGTSVGMNIVGTVGGRMFQEFTAYCISNDVPYLGDTFYYVLCNPSDRSAIDTSVTVQKINKTVNEINNKLDGMIGSLDDIKDGVNVSNTQQTYIDSKNDLDNYWNENYSSVWNSYMRTVEKENEIQTKLDNGSKITDEDVVKLQTQAEEYMDSFVTNYKVYVADLTSTSTGYYDINVFKSEMKKLNEYVVNYLVSSENYLRSLYPFEHEITDEMFSCYQYVLEIETKVFEMHKAYSVYSETLSKIDNGEENPTVNEVTEFTEETEIFENMLQTQVENSEIHNYMVTDEFISNLERELKESNDGKLPDSYKDYNPPKVETSTKICGKDVPCYRVRDNQSLDYFLITQQSESLNSSVESWKNGIKKTVYRPTVVLEQKYTDDGQYKMISSLSEMPSLNSTKNLLNYLRSEDTGLGLSKISQDTDYIILDNCSYSKKGLWNMQFVSIDGEYSSGTTNNVKTKSSDDVYDNSGDTFIRIYRSVTEDNLFNSKSDKHWTVSSISDVPTTISLHDGQILDLSQITESPKNPITIIVSGECTIIGNPNTTFNNVNIIINTNEQVTIKNLKTKCTQYGTPIEVKSKDSKIKFEGNNTFNGNGGKVDEEIYCQYDYNNNPVGTSQGMLIDQGGSVTITGGNVTFNGSCGGSGICPVGDLTISNCTVTANGSQQENKLYYRNGFGQYYISVSSLGSGIGYSIGYSTSSDENGQTYKSYGKVNIENSTVNANGVTSNTEDDTYSQDIGGVKCVSSVTEGKAKPYNYTTKELPGGHISNSTVNTKYGRIDSGFTYSNSSSNNDVYTVTTVTSGSNGVTPDGISIKVHGSKGTTDWMKLSSLGDSKGTETGTVTGKGVGEIQYIEVKSNSSNCWYPEKITVENQIGGSEKTFYGGKWISNNEQTLKQSDNVYELTIKTGTVDHSGTDCEVYGQLVDENGKESGWTHLSEIHPDKDAFENGDESTFYISVPSDFGKIQYVELKSESNGSSCSDWYIDDITVKQIQGSNVGDGFSVNPDQWDVNDKVMSFGKESGKIGTFDIEIKTSGSSGSGTDSDIDIELIGENGSTGRVNIDNYVEDYTPGNNFEKNDTDKCRITFNLGKDGLGKLKEIKIYNNGGGSGSDWKVDYIKVTEINPDGSKGTTYQFNINDWINSGKNISCTNVTIS